MSTITLYSCDSCTYRKQVLLLLEWIGMAKESIFSLNLTEKYCEKIRVMEENSAISTPNDHTSPYVYGHIIIERFLVFIIFAFILMCLEIIFCIRHSRWNTTRRRHKPLSEFHIMTMILWGEIAEGNLHIFKGFSLLPFHTSSPKSIPLKSPQFPLNRLFYHLESNDRMMNPCCIHRKDALITS